MLTTINTEYEGYCHIKKNKLRKSLYNAGSIVLEINIEYPSLEDQHEAFVKKFNTLYCEIAEKFLKYCEEVLYKKIISGINKKEIKKPFGEVIKYYITCNNEKYLSVVWDITHYDGYFSSTSRYSQTWNIQKESILPCNYFLKKINLNSKDAKKKIADLVLSEFENDPSGFDYNIKGIRRIMNKIDLNNFFLTTRGIAFWFEKNTITSGKDGFPAYILESDDIYK